MAKSSEVRKCGPFKLRQGWQLREEFPIFLIVFIIVSGIMWYYNIGNPSQIFGTGFFAAAVIVALEVITTGKCRI